MAIRPTKRPNAETTRMAASYRFASFGLSLQYSVAIGGLFTFAVSCAEVRPRTGAGLAGFAGSGFTTTRRFEESDGGDG